MSRLVQAENYDINKKKDGPHSGHSSPNNDSHNGKRLRNIERREMMRRIWVSFMKYLVRNPIYEQYTKPILIKVCKGVILNQNVVTLVLALIDYFRYYTYIA